MTSERRRTRDLPEDVKLPLSSGEPWWNWLGGRPALDLVNTRRERWRRSVETLVTPRDLSRWFVEARVLPEVMPVPRAVLAEARELREAIDACVVAAAQGAPAARGAVRTIDDWLVHAGSRPRLARDESGVPRLGERAPADSPRRALGTIALDAARMLGIDSERSRVRICAGDRCSARFYDRSPAAARVWCSMRTCGNAAKARRHRRRRTGAAA